MSMNIGEIVSTLEELVVRVALLEKTVTTLESEVNGLLTPDEPTTEDTGA